MKRRGWGRIVNMASSTFFDRRLGLRALHRQQGRHASGSTRALATELGPHGITVNAIAPALTRTPGALARGPRAGETDMEHSFAVAAARQAIPRAQVPADLVGTVSFLSSDDAAFITGQTLHVSRRRAARCCAASEARRSEQMHGVRGEEADRHERQARSARARRRDRLSTHHAGDHRRRRQHDADLERGRRDLVVVVALQRGVALAPRRRSRAPSVRGGPRRRAD